jgi:hypothetical protein
MCTNADVPVGQRRCSPTPRNGTGVVCVDVDSSRGFQQARVAHVEQTEAVATLRTGRRRRCVRRKLPHPQNFEPRSVTEELATRRPGIVHASARCDSYDGRWANRAGFDMEGLCVTGFTTEEGTLDRPAFPPTQSGVLFDQREKSLVQMTSVNVYPF